MEVQEKIKILYVDDEVSNLNTFKVTFRKDYDILVANSAKEGLEVLKENDVHIIITDQRMPEVTGVEFLESAITDYPDPIRMLLTGYSDIEAVVNAINNGHIYSFISKPWNVKEMKVFIENAYEVYHLREEKLKLINKLVKANNQLEFILRQRLIS
ncbi:MAG: response regulator [Bacteroidetes bacterium]|nr:response regulator [Bacteroidota bacterium]